MKDLFRLFVLKLFIIYCYAICEYPDWIQNKVWNDRTKRQLTFSVTTMTGWTYRLYSDTITEWECDLKFKNDETFVASRSKDTYTIFGAHYRAYLCHKFEKIEENVTYYNLMADISESGKIVHITNEVPVDICDVCSGPGNEGSYIISVDSNSNNETEPPAGCNPCLYHCDKSGTPIITTTSNPDDSETPLTERAPTRFDNKAATSEQSSNAKLIGGIVGAVSFILLVTVLMVWLTRRGFCVTNVLETFYEEKHFHTT
ncbi:uncharacterized protein LOC127714979 isoform X1 [Mytilus californianus]|uniref:uncharacterized protein LOC127714979 isoform X1 n=1 Tax=Mytilus californianus TaxID=6549 RepID=UPI002248548D|nr:uncharacterized protein LOC127714979 isoform X1 [Mytilus californianus]